MRNNGKNVNEIVSFNEVSAMFVGFTKSFINILQKYNDSFGPS